MHKREVKRIIFWWGFFKYEKIYDEFYKIYRWIFQDSNEYDKIELTRHVISIHCKYSDILNIDEKTFLSIKSNYNIYLKENVDKYIELKNLVKPPVARKEDKYQQIGTKWTDEEDNKLVIRK